MSELDCQGLAKTVGESDRAAVLRGVSFHVRAGSCVGLSGATGSGKTTLLRLIAGLEAPDRGEIRIDGRLASSPAWLLPPGQRRIGFVFQGLGLWPHLDVAGHLDYVLAASPLKGQARARHKDDLLEAFRLRDLRRRMPAELSGGEKHLLAIARALAGEVRLLLLDEPFAGLDGSLKSRVLETVARYRRARGLTAILVSHQTDELNALCEERLHLREGHIAPPLGRQASAYGEGGGGARP
ncbi:MAG: ATP-binding cassette domain-containing protein [Planctomycetota bacterium]|nr:ATP-binding cassette domain-containing protein [Planctomycetota bacterium]